MVQIPLGNSTGASCKRIQFSPFCFFFFNPQKTIMFIDPPGLLVSRWPLCRHSCNKPGCCILHCLGMTAPNQDMDRVSGYPVPLLVVYRGTFLVDMQLGGGVLKSLFWQYSSCLGRPEFGWKMPEYQKGENKQNRKQTNKQKPLSKPIPSPGVEDPGYLSVLRQPFSKSPENWKSLDRWIQ